MNMRCSIMRSGVAAVAALAIAAPLCTARAQTTPPAPTPAPAAGAATEPSPEATRLADEIIAKTSANRQATIRAMSAPMVGMMQQFGVHQPDRAKTMVDEVIMPMLSAHIDELFALQARSYAVTFSVDDLKGLNAFYDTPAGRDVLALQPKLSSSLISNTTQWLRALSPELQTKMQAAIKAHGWDKDDNSNSPEPQ